MSVKACTSFLLWYFTMFPVPPSCSMETAKLLLDCRLTSTLESCVTNSPPQQLTGQFTLLGSTGLGDTVSSLP